MLYGNISLKMTPVRVRTLSSFTAPNPWIPGSPAASAWTLEVYRMVNEQTLQMSGGMASSLTRSQGSGETLGKAEVLGIRSDADGRYHMLPEALGRLWLEKRVRTEQLPEFLHRIEPNLKKADFFSARLNSTTPWVALGIFILALIMFGVRLFAGPKPEHRFRNVSANEWLNTPVTAAQTVNVQGLVPVLEVIPAGHVAAPAGLYSYWTDSNLGWYRAADGDRLILQPGGYVGYNGKFQPRDMSARGPVIRTADLNLPPALLARARALDPKLKTDFILCDSWSWRDSHSILSQVGGVLLWSGYFYTLLALIFYGLYASRKARIARQTESFSNLLQGAGASR